MGVDPSTLRLRIASTDIVASDPSRIYMRLTYDVFHPASGAVVVSRALVEQFTDVTQIQARDTALVNRALAEFETAKWLYGSNASLGGYSPFDVSLMLERWSFGPNGANWDLSHPLSGTFNNVAIAGTPFPAIIDRAAAIIARVLPPSIWAWATSPEASVLRVWCVAVSGAASYNVYHDNGDGTYTLLGNQPTANNTNHNVAAGYYRVRVAPVSAGSVVGILSKTTDVIVS